MFSIFDGFDANCCLLTTSCTLTSSMLTMLENDDAQVKVCGSYGSLKAALSDDTTINYIFIDLDSFDGIAAQFDTIKKLRETHADKSVVLLSSDFAMNEYGTHRLMLADVSLRLPVTMSSLEIALMQAPVNNKTWCHRMAATQDVAATPAPVRQFQHESSSA